MDTTISIYYTPIDTTNYHDTIPLLIQQPIKLLYSTWYNNSIRYLLIQQATTFVLYSYWYKNPICYYTPIDTTIYYVTIFLLIQQTTKPLYSYWYNYPICNLTLLIQQTIMLLYSYRYNNLSLPYSNWYNKLLRNR